MQKEISDDAIALTGMQLNEYVAERSLAPGHMRSFAYTTCMSAMLRSLVPDHAGNCAIVGEMIYR